MRVLPLLIIAALVACCVFGSPAETVANTFWTTDAAPWETVDGFFYPDRADLSQSIRQIGLANKAACQQWASARAADAGDPGMLRTDHECGVGRPEAWKGLAVYRLTVK